MGDERGTVTVFVVVFMVALMGVAGLVIDGGNLLAARREAGNVAESAARAGAQEIDETAARTTGIIRLEPRAAQRRAEDFLAATGYAGTVTVEGNSVFVEVTVTRSLFILDFGGLAEASVTGRGAAHGVRGVAEEES